ncbi:MAG TPA: zinc ribbon domain-containing protein [Blastocatellia bacterium]|nr:zinc ribbon domain-containing protein [Blastocatellia bacterium]
MGTVYCDNCGTSLLEETAKFCRACGKPTPLSEAATKRFDEQPIVQAHTSPVGPSLTTPAYMAPFDAPPALQTADLRQKTQKRNLIILLSMLAVMIFALAGLLAFLNFGLGPEGIRAPPPPPGFSRPPPLPPPPGINGPSTIDQSLIYPGARQTMSFNQEGGKSVLQLQSDDPAVKVARWYIARLKITKKVATAGQTILRAGDIGVVIMGSDEGVQILITRGGEEQ